MTTKKKIVELESPLASYITGHGLSISLGMAKDYFENETRLRDHEIDGFLSNYFIRVSPAFIGQALCIFDRTELSRVGINNDIPEGSWYLQFGNELRVINRGE